MRVGTVLETCLYVDDLAAAEAFYRDVLGLELESRVAERHAFFRCGPAMLLLFNPEATRVPSGDVPTHGATGQGHVAFRATHAELDAWRDRLAEQGVPVETDLHWPGGGRSLYFRDPAGNCLELVTPDVWGLA
ncbi:MAG TPA: VOC family protein [Thermomicrobiaceae bacterium]|nr:VOC family protein [Thermomicrobiaceae bacterium]